MESVKKNIVQKLKIHDEDVLVGAERYYAILSAVNNLGLTQREIQLVAFTAIKGNMSYKYLKDEFCENHKTSTPTINNIISKLKRMSVLIKDEGKKIRVNPIILLPFKEANISLEINMTNGKA